MLLILIAAAWGHAGYYESRPPILLLLLAGGATLDEYEGPSPAHRLREQRHDFYGAAQTPLGLKAVGAAKLE